MAAIAPPAATPIVATVIAAPGAATLHVHFLAGGQVVMSFPCLDWTQHPAPPGGGQATASVPMSVAIRTWCGRLTLADPASIVFASTISCFTIAFTDVAWTRFMTELVSSGLLSGAPYVRMRDADAVLLTLTIKIPASLGIQVNDFLLIESFDTPAVPAIPPVAAVGGRGRGRGRAGGQGAPAIPGVPAVPMVPGPMNLAFLNSCSLANFADCGSRHSIMLFARLVGAVGDSPTRISRISQHFPAHSLAHALRRAVATVAGVDPSVAAAPHGDLIIFMSLPATLEAAFYSLTTTLHVDVASTTGLREELRDALLMQQGNSAQCQAVITRRLIFIADRCDPPLHCSPHRPPLGHARGLG